jgi:transposase-like protein
MTETIGVVPDLIDQQRLAQQLVQAARAEGVELVGPGGLLTGLTKTVLETALEAEMTEHLGYDPARPSRSGQRELPQRHPNEDGADRDRARRDRGPARPGRQLRPGHCAQTPTPPRRHRRDRAVVDRPWVDHGEIAAHFAEVYGAKVSRDTISRITDKVVEEMAQWQDRPLDAVYPVLFIDAIQVKVRDGQVTNRPFYVVIGVTVDGHRDILGIWAGDGGEGAKTSHVP